MPATPLLVCADDFGYSADVDAGIARLVEAGRVTAASCLTASSRWQDAARLARTLRPLADVGLHLDLTEFERLGSLPGVLLAGRAGLLDRKRVRAAIRSQLDAFEDGIGAPPDYVDGHQHVHQLPVVAAAVLEELGTRYLTRQPWVRVSWAPEKALKSRVITGLGAAALARACERRGLRHTRRLLGVYDFRASPSYAQRLATWLGAARGGDALMVHPAQRASPADPLGQARVREFTALLAPETAALFARAQVVAARGDSLRTPRPQ
jgi:predicted glycoside hydrolase/deacetylase ChbG (UPF0249 family)